jgi:D-apionolactonase
VPRELTKNQLLRGVDEPSPAAHVLNAGGLVLEFDGADLRYVRSGNVEAVRRIYPSVRDVNWNTIAGEMSDLSIRTEPDSFRITFQSRHRTQEIDFEWVAQIDGGPDGRVSYSMEGQARTSFRYCRVGFCILHPIRGTAGRKYRATTPDGLVEGTFPRLVAPQPFVGGVYLPLFPAFSSLSVALEGGATLTCDCEGDLFEIEDQRNWTDGSFKTYCTPAALGFPFRAEAGQRFYQRISLSVAPVAEPIGASPRDASLRVGRVAGRMPSVGFGMSSQTGKLDEREAALIRGLRPAHLRVDLHLSDASWTGELERAIRDAGAVDTALEVAAFVTDEAEQELSALAGRLCGIRVARYLVFHESEASETSTSPRWVAQARRCLATVSPGAAFAGGTNGNFAEVNRARPDPHDYDELCYPLNPQVHAFDDRSMVEALEGQGDAARTARSFSGDRPIVVSAVTLKPPFNQAAVEDEKPIGPGEIPPQVDRRQMSQFAAAWTVGSLGALARAGVASATYYETVGWRGLVEATNGSPLPDIFPSLPGMIFPIYRVFASVADASGARVFESVSNDALIVDGLAFKVGGRMRLLVANMTPDTRLVRLRGLTFERGTLVRIWGPPTADLAAIPGSVSGPSASVSVDDGELGVALEAFEVVRIDQADEQAVASSPAGQAGRPTLPPLRRGPRQSRPG